MPTRFTQKMTMHLNGGKAFSELRYDIYADGKPTSLKRLTRTSGRPRYLKTADVIWDARSPEDPASSFDVLATRGVGLTEFLESRIAKDAVPAAGGEGA